VNRSQACSVIAGIHDTFRQPACINTLAQALQRIETRIVRSNKKRFAFRPTPSFPPLMEHANTPRTCTLAFTHAIQHMHTHTHAQRRRRQALLQREKERPSSFVRPGNGRLTSLFTRGKEKYKTGKKSFCNGLPRQQTWEQLVFQNSRKNAWANRPTDRCPIPSKPPPPPCTA